MSDGDVGGRRTNGLDAGSFSRLSDVDPRLAPELLEALAVASIAAYVSPATGSMDIFLRRSLPPRPLHSLFVDADRIGLARGIVEPLLASSAVDDEAAAFDAIVAGFDQTPDLPTRMAPVEETETGGTPANPGVDPASYTSSGPAWGPRDYEPEPEEEHYVPPPLAPRPPVHPTTKWAWLALALGALLFIRPGLIGMERGDATVLVGTSAILLGAGLLFTRLRDSGPDDDIDNDGAVV